MENRPYLCPACAKPLIRNIGSDGLYWECEDCRHTLTSLTILRRTSVISFITLLWRDALANPSGGGLCPVCVKPMALVPREAACFQICVSCEMFWMGEAEKDLLPKPPIVESAAPLPNKAAEMLARADMLMAQQKPGAFESESRHGLFWALGIPSQPGGENWKRFPWMTLLILCAMFAANGLLNWFGYWDLASSFSLWPGGVGSPLMPLFYVYGGFLNLMLSAYLLLLLGTSVENKVGPLHFLAIFALPSLLGGMFSLIVSTHAGWVVGASGGVASVMVFFLFAFPKRKISWPIASHQAVYGILAWFLFQFLFGLPFNNWFTGVFTAFIWVEPFADGLTGISCEQKWG